MAVMTTTALTDRHIDQLVYVVTSFDHHKILTSSTQCAYWYTPIPTFYPVFYPVFGMFYLIY